MPEGGKRDSHEILMSMLESAKRGTVKTRILQRSNLSYQQLVKYLDLLESRGFIKREKVGKKEIWKTTEKGLNVLEACQVCRLIVRESEGMDP